MAALPTPGGSDGTYGTELNAYLVIGHATDGTHKEAGLTQQIVNTQLGTGSSGTTASPLDNTTPQITEGNEVFTLAITPKNSSNKLKIDVVVSVSASAAANVVCALFQDSTANALAAIVVRITGDGQLNIATFTHFMTAGTTSSTTFKVRVGIAAGATVFWNRTSSESKFNGVMASSITITEIWV